jgi:anaerobic magnesium-protoporphyrin IX monomethyl ester cyclase
LKVVISYPPIMNKHGQLAMVPQNRNVQFFEKPNFLLAIVHAQAATWLKQLGYKVIWDDSSSQLKTYENWYTELLLEKPDVVVFEGTTPVMNFYWEQINKIKVDLPNCIVIMTGYHSMRRGDETMQKSAADIVLRSSHIDFVLKQLIPFIDEHTNWRETCNVDGLIIRRDDGTTRSTGAFKQVEPLDNSPDIDRDLVQWKNYAFENGNFLNTPGTYATSVIRDCMFGKCTFCRYNGPDLTFSVRSVQRSLDEYQRLIEDYGVREIFDDSGVWYRGEEAREFAKGIIDRGLHKKDCFFGFNTRFGYMDEVTVALLGKANFRFVLLGLEAADNETLIRLNKGYSIDAVEQNLAIFKKHGLHPHLTMMVGYYWQTQEQLDQTVNTVRRYMFEGLARTLQITICIPLDYTPYHMECINKGVLLTHNYDDFDMSKVIVKTPIPHERYYRAISDILGIAFDPKFILRQLVFLCSFRKRDWKFLFVYGWRALRRVRNVRHSLTRHFKEGGEKANYIPEDEIYKKSAN